MDGRVFRYVVVKDSALTLSPRSAPSPSPATGDGTDPLGVSGCPMPAVDLRCATSGRRPGSTSRWRAGRRGRVGRVGSGRCGALGGRRPRRLRRAGL